MVNAACNNGTSALVTKEGELFMFGKDSAYCDGNTGIAHPQHNANINANFLFIIIRIKIFHLFFISFIDNLIINIKYFLIFNLI